MDLTNEEFVEIMDKIMQLEPGEEEQLLEESYQRFRNSDYNEEEEDYEDEEEEEWD